MIDSDGYAFYNLDGIVLRSAPKEDDRFIEVAFTYLIPSDLDDQLLISIAAMHMVLTEDLGIDYVFSSYTLQRCVMHAPELTLDAQRRLAEAVVGARRNMGLVYRLAD